MFIPNIIQNKPCSQIKSLLQIIHHFCHLKGSLLGATLLLTLLCINDLLLEILWCSPTVSDLLLGYNFRRNFIC
uniref:Uncharacterized protein n=1 Tax=Glycine max TaxID=3847 RepID=C6TEN4_SOYBN|nr:unknown [Glycine max]